MTGRAAGFALILGIILVAVATGVLAVPIGAGRNIPWVKGAPKCRVFPPNNQWNTNVSKLPVHPKSSTYVNSIGASDSLVPDLGSGRYRGARIGIPYNVVGKRQRRVKVRFRYADESNRVRYPIPRRPKIEQGSSDRHILIVDRSRCRLYELFNARRRRSRWHAGSGAVFNLNSNKLRPKGWTSADAAGLPILPGLARYEEVRRGRINHALRFTVGRTRRAYVYPARHFASDSNDPDLPPMGLRVRLKSSYDISGFPRQARVILRALQRYGMLLADNGGNWFISGPPDRRWNNDDLHTIRKVKGKDLEVVDTSSLPKPGE